MPDEETDEPSDEEMLLWLQTPTGLAAMQQIMLNMKEGRYGEMGPELLEAAEQGLAARENLLNVQAVKERVHGLMQQMDEPMEGSHWQYMHDLHEEMKAIMDLMLDFPEPHRTTLMKMALPVQARLERLEKEQ